MRLRPLGTVAAILLANCVILGNAAGPATAASAPRWRLVQVLPVVEQEVYVAASGPTSAWATGYVTSTDKLDVERWNGAAWQPIAPPPHLGTLGTVYTGGVWAAVGSSSPGNAWVFPTVHQGTARVTYALHWHNSQWTSSRLPQGARIADTAVFSDRDAWAFGTVGSGRRLTAYDLRYRGGRWRRVRLPGAPYAVSALSPRDMWAIGPSAATLDKPASKQITLAMHWNGRAWSAHSVPGPPPPRRGYLDDHIAAAGPHGLWYAYINFDHNYNYVSSGLLHWKGGRWQRLHLPASLRTIFLNSAAPDGRGGLWACSPVATYHYTGGRWTRWRLPGKDPGCNALAWVPGSASVWAVGSIRTASLDLEGAFFRYGS